jgi:serine/threonine protein phosphatase PrpC
MEAIEAMEIVALSDTGRVRQNNEDAVAYDVDAGVALLADGMGGLAGGEIASQVAVAVVLDAVRGQESGGEMADEDALVEAFEAANVAVRRAAQEAGSEMGTTLVAWVSPTPGECIVAHVGDSRVYRVRGSELERLTSDHSMVQQLVDDGVLSEVEASTSPHRNVITRALGLEEGVRVDVSSWSYAPDDLFLLCSDGLTDMVSEREIGATLEAQGGNEGDLVVAAEALVAEAIEAGGHDNVSVVLVRPGAGPL